jgi:hypothetical protein
MLIETSAWAFVIAGLLLRLVVCADKSCPDHAIIHTASICETYPLLEESGVIDVLIPKKEPLLLGKW